MEQNVQIRQLTEWLQTSQRTVVLTGAGMSTESGIPDFRSRSGWWKSIDPQTVATVEALQEDYDTFQEFYSTRIQGLQNLHPHRGHEILAEWERKGLIHSIATQNVDRFHQQAGNTRVYELHGNIRSARCRHCDADAPLEHFLGNKPCAVCGDRLRPNVVLFGEMLPEEPWREALTSIRSADLVLVIGTSLQVYPVASLPSMTAGRVAILNLEGTDQDSSFDLVVSGKAGELLQALHMQMYNFD